MSMIVSTIGQGLLWAILGVALFLTFRILNFADMTVEGEDSQQRCRESR